MDTTYKSTKYAASQIKKSRPYFLEIAKLLELEPKKINLLFLWADDQIKLVDEYRKPNPRNYVIPEEQKQEIIHCFKTEKNNGVKQLSEQFLLPQSRINAVLDEYFDNIKKQIK